METEQHKPKKEESNPDMISQNNSNSINSNNSNFNYTSFSKLLEGVVLAANSSHSPNPSLKTDVFQVFFYSFFNFICCLIIFFLLILI